MGISRRRSENILFIIFALFIVLAPLLAINLVPDMPFPLKWNLYAKLRHFCKVKYLDAATGSDLSEVVTRAGPGVKIKDLGTLFIQVRPYCLQHKDAKIDAAYLCPDGDAWAGEPKRSKDVCANI